MGKKKKKRNIEDAAKVCWALVDLCNNMLKDKTLSQKMIARWARIQSQVLRTLTVILARDQSDEGIKDDLARILESVPKKYREMIKNEFKYASSKKATR